VCARVKAKTLPFPSATETRAEGVLERVHVDLLTFSERGLDRSKYALVVTDDRSLGVGRAAA
jgi:hypothetical protein